MKTNSELAVAAVMLPSSRRCHLRPRFPVHGGKKASGSCSKCGHNLIRGFGVSVCENLVCDSLPKNIAPAASLEAWAGL